MKEIQLTQGRIALVDDEDYQWLNTVKWKFHKGYVERQEKNPRNDGKWTTVSMHRRIMGLGYGDVRVVDHRDGNPLNNQKSNLRICTSLENARNARHNARNTSGFKGVSYHKGCKRWVATIRDGARKRHLGTFDSPELAYEAYCKAAEEIHASFANFGDAVSNQNESRIASPSRNNRTGFTGVTEYRGAWRADFRRNGVRRYVGNFASPEEAYAAYCSATKQFDDEARKLIEQVDKEASNA